MTHQQVLILDFGSQFTQLIARRVRENRVYCEVHPCDLPLAEIRRREPIGDHPLGRTAERLRRVGAARDAELFGLGVPVLGICYGMQALAHALGGEVDRAERREYGRAEIDGERAGAPSSRGSTARETVWMSHGDHVAAPPPGVVRDAPAAPTPAIVAVEDPGRRLFGIQFHPEVSHTLQRRRRCCATSSTASATPAATGPWPPSSRRRSADLRAQVGERAGCSAASRAASTRR